MKTNSTTTHDKLTAKICKEDKAGKIEIGAGNCITRVEDWQAIGVFDSDFIRINTDLAKKLRIPAMPYRYEFNSDKRVYLGPVVGILTTEVEHKKLYPHGRKEKVFKEIISAALKQGILVFYFFPDGLDYKNRCIKGHSMDVNNRWFSGKFPIPDVVYNRILYRYLENMPSVKKVLSYFAANPGVYLFNSRYLDKWEVYLALNKDPHTSAYQPETDLLNNIKLTYFLKKYPEIYIKPRRSSKGQGITKLKRTDRQGVIYSHATKARGIWRNANNRYIINRMYRIKNNYLLQEGIKLAKYNNRVFDIRAQAQKDGNGNWVLTGAAVRVAAPNAFVTHIPNGGTARPLNEVISGVFAGNYELIANIEQELAELSCKVSQVLEDELKINLGVVSLDIGIDGEGRLWLLEVNSKPASFDEDSIRSKHVNYLIEYFIYIAQSTR
jgi:glutathione synthase/RimK-type ligase-like ATP-grasp enzyme